MVIKARKGPEEVKFPDSGRSTPERHDYNVIALRSAEEKWKIKTIIVSDEGAHGWVPNEIPTSVQGKA